MVGVFSASNSTREISSVCSEHAGMQFHAKRVIKVKSACSRGTKCGGSTFEGRLWPKYKETIATQPAPGEELCGLAALVCSSRGDRDGFISSGEAKMIYFSIDWIIYSFFMVVST